MHYGLNSPSIKSSSVSDINAAGNIIQILANLPDFLRKPMMQGRLKEFFAMTEDNRRETIAMALAAAPSIDPAKLAVLVKTWLEIISEFDPEKKVCLVQSIFAAGAVQPQVHSKAGFHNAYEHLQFVK